MVISLTHKVCPSCGENKKVETDFYLRTEKGRKGSPVHTCKKCHLKTTKENRLKDPEKYRQTQKNLYNKLKLEVLTYYSIGSSPKCACCKESFIDFLSIDHIDPESRKLHDTPGKSKLTGASLYRWLKDNNYPNIVQVLCHNCNQAKHMLGECPHGSETYPMKRVLKLARKYKKQGW